MGVSQLLLYECYYSHHLLPLHQDKGSLSSQVAQCLVMAGWFGRFWGARSPLSVRTSPQLC